jgi:flagellar FliL protein
MSAAAVDAVEAPKQKKRLSKKLLIILVAVTVLLLAAGGAAFYVMKQRAAAAAAAAAENGEETADAAGEPEKKKEHKGPPSFLPLDAFVVNLADRDQERYAQVGITLQIEDPKTAEELKLYMPAIRNGVLMILAHKTSAELLEREGKELLAEEIMREAVRPLGIELDPPAAAASGAPVRKKKRAEPEVHNPVEHVHFSSFIIQ